jgi:hypothetical protein
VARREEEERIKCCSVSGRRQSDASGRVLGDLEPLWSQPDSWRLRRLAHSVVVMAELGHMRADAGQPRPVVTR